MAVNKYLLKQAQLRVKQAFMPPEQAGAPPGAPPMDPSMGGAPPQGAPPMDPAIAGGAPPMDPAAAGGAPPMDPSMGGGAPPMDPAMAGGAPPMDPSMGAPPDPTEQIRSVVKDEMQRAMAEAKGGGKGSAKKNDGAQTEVYMHRIQKLMTHLYSSLGLNLPNDILDDPKGQQGSDGQQQGPGGAPSQGAQPMKTAADNFSVSEKAAGILHLLRLKKD